MVDVISGGRLIAGFPVGTSMDDNYAFGANPAALRGVLAAQGEAWCKGIPGARQVTLPDVGHLAELEQPDAFATLVGDFLAGAD